MDDVITPHQRPNRSRLEVWRDEIAEMRSKAWPYSRISTWLRDTHDLAISREAVRQFCCLRGIQKGGETRMPELGRSSGRAEGRKAVVSSPRISPQKEQKKLMFDFDESRPIDRWEKPKTSAPSEE